MTVQTAPALATTPAAGRRPRSVLVVCLLTLLAAVVTSYGAYYFSFVFEDPSPGAGTYAFVTVFWAIALTAALAAVGLLRGSETARRVLVGYGWAQVAWTVAKLVFWQETEALVFGAVTVATLAVVHGRAARRWTAA